MFGKSQSVPLSEVKAQVESLVCRPGRDNILVFHGDHSDQKATFRDLAAIFDCVPQPGFAIS